MMLAWAALVSQCGWATANTPEPGTFFGNLVGVGCLLFIGNLSLRRQLSQHRLSIVAWQVSLAVLTAVTLMRAYHQPDSLEDSPALVSFFAAFGGGAMLVLAGMWARVCFASQPQPSQDKSEDLYQQVTYPGQPAVDPLLGRESHDLN